MAELRPWYGYAEGGAVSEDELGNLYDASGKIINNRLRPLQAPTQETPQPQYTRGLIREEDLKPTQSIPQNLLRMFSPVRMVNALLPVGYDEQGNVSPAMPSIVADPVESWTNLVDRHRAGIDDPEADVRDSFVVSSSLGLGGLAATPMKEVGAIGTMGGRALKTSTDLPMDLHSRMARAKEMGFDTDKTWYHGTTHDFPEFDIKKANRDNPRAVYLASEPNTANYFSRSRLENSRVLPLRVKEGKYFDFENPEHSAALTEFLKDKKSTDIYPGYLGSPDNSVLLNSLSWGDYGLLENKAVQDWMKKNGYEGWYAREREGAPKTLAVKDPSNIRSVNAAFDPAKSESANLLAANPLFAAAIPLALRDEEPDRKPRSFYGGWGPKWGQKKDKYADGGDVSTDEKRFFTRRNDAIVDRGEGRGTVDNYLRNSPIFGYRNPASELYNLVAPATETKSDRPMRYRVLDTLGAAVNLPVRMATLGEYNTADLVQGLTGRDFPAVRESEQRFYENNQPLMRPIQALGEALPFGVKGVPHIPEAKLRFAPLKDEAVRFGMDESGSVPFDKTPPKPAPEENLPSVNEIQQKASSPIQTKSQAELEQDLLSWWGNKHKEEAKREKKLLKGASSGAKSVREKGKRDKVDVDLYRKMQEEQGQEAVLEAVRKGQHLRPDGKGGYIGAPRTVTSPQSLGQMRKSLDEKFQQGVDALTLADPERVGTWYDRAKFNQQLSNEPYQLPRVLEQHAAYSAGVSPESELTFALKHGTSRAIGDPIIAYRKPAANRLDNAVAKAIDMKLGPKISMYKSQNDPRIPNKGLFGVNDFRAAQAFGYTTPQGKPFQGTVSPTMHPFMDAETALMTDRANVGEIGGRSNWQGPHTQEVPWITGKAQDLYKRGSTKKGRFSGDKLEGAKAALREANNTFGDYLYKHAISATHEQVPGKSTGHIPEILEAPFEERLSYSKEAPWAVRKEAADPYERDPIYSALGLRQLPQVPSTGLFKNSEGAIEMNPMTISRPLGYYPTGGARLDDNMLEAIKVAEMFRAVNDAQEAGAANLPNTGNISGRNALVIDTRPSGETLTGVQPTVSQLGAISQALKDTGFDATATNRGVLVFPYEPHKTPASVATKLEKQLKPIIEKEFPSATTEKGIADTVYVPGIGKIDRKGNIVPTKPFTGEATMGFLKRAAKANPTLARNLSEDEAIRNVLNKIIERDMKYKSSREDIQNTRKFFRDADWNKAVELIRGGMKPAAALAALGYSFAALADEPERAE